jgi:hypothetical protein
MPRDTTDSKSHSENAFTTELRRALQDHDFQEALQGEAGVFSIRYLFINEYINYINLLKSNPKYKPIIKPSSSMDFGRVFALIKKMAGEKKRNHIDFLFISRDRQVKAKVKSGYLIGDYIFYSVIDELMRRHPECRIQMYISDNSYDKYYFASLSDLARSMHIALKSSLKWTFFKRGILKRLNALDCNHVTSTASYFFHPRILLRMTLMGLSMANMLSMTRPEVIVSNDDCMYTKPLNNDAKMIVLQSASIVRNIEDCRALIFRDSRMQPDYFLCSGSESAEIKDKASAARKVVITGQPRYDILFNMQVLYSRKDFKERYGIKQEQKIVLWATQTHGFSHEENCDNLQAVFEAFQGLEDVTLIIKQHPAETEDHTALIKDFLDHNDVNSILTAKDSDTYEQLFACDLMITRHSTTALEAVALGKPVIILNLSKESDIVDYVSEKVAAGVYEKKKLRETILRLLDDDEELKKNREAYLDRHLFKIDGKATERVLNVIDQMIDLKEC